MIPTLLGLLAILVILSIALLAQRWIMPDLPTLLKLLHPKVFHPKRPF
jgi:hypothetical protein